MKLKLTIQDAVYHRNGISGTEFYAVLFKTKEYGNMLGTVFSEPGCCAIYQLKDGINIHECWHGDHFEKALWEATAKFLNRKLLFS